MKLKKSESSEWENSSNSSDSSDSSDSEKKLTRTLILTENGAHAYETTGKIALDFFTRIVRDAPVDYYIPLFVEMFNDNNNMAMKVLMNLRDVRNGKGEKRIPQMILFLLKLKKPKIYKKVVKTIVVDFGYWKDLLMICELTKKYNKESSNSFEIGLFAEQLKLDNKNLKENSNAGISLAGKWAPSENTHFDKYPLKLAKSIREKMEMDSKSYRKLLSRLREHLKVLEMYMSTEQYEKINFSHIPSIAHTNYRNAFKRSENSLDEHKEERQKLSDRYNTYLFKLKNGSKDVKINASGLHPHQVINKYCNNLDGTLDDTLEEQWKVISKNISDKGSFDKTMAVVDVSASMNGIPMEVAIALGILVAENTKGTFKNRMITFHENPSWMNIDDCNTLREKVDKVSRMDWGGNTNILKVFELILDQAIMYNIDKEHMIETLFIFTDMQFDSCNNVYGSKWESGPWETTIKTIKRLYQENGYTPPNIIFWNLSTSCSKTLPFGESEENVASLSGFSSELLKSVMNMEKLDAVSVFMKIMDKYNPPIFPKTMINNFDLEKLKGI